MISYVLGALFAAGIAVGSGDAAVVEGTEIMKGVHERPTPARIYARLKMTIVEGGGAKKERVLKSWVMRTPQATKSVMLFEQPSDVRNAGFLSVDWDDASKNDDQWLYLPSLRKASRIAAGERSGSFMGSDFSYSDLSRLGFEEFSYRLLSESESVAGEDCWLVEVMPKGARAGKKTGYTKTHQWISKSKKLPLQVKAWLADGSDIKFLRFADIKRVDGRWIPQRLLARTMRGKKVLSTTVLEYLSLDLNPSALTEADFSVRRLERGL